FLRIASLWKTEDFDFHPVNLEPVKPFLELLVAVSLSDLGHRELSRTVCTENTRPLLVIPGDPQRIFRIAVPGLQIVIADGPVYGLFQVGIACFQSEIPWDVTWTVAAPSPGAAANQTLVLALENIRAANLSVIKFIIRISQGEIRCVRAVREFVVIIVHIGFRRSFIFVSGFGEEFDECFPVSLLEPLLARVKHQYIAFGSRELPGDQRPCHTRADYHNVIFVSHDCNSPFVPFVSLRVWSPSNRTSEWS